MKAFSKLSISSKLLEISRKHPISSKLLSSSIFWMIFLFASPVNPPLPLPGRMASGRMSLALKYKESSQSFWPTGSTDEEERGRNSGIKEGLNQSISLFSQLDEHFNYGRLGFSIYWHNCGIGIQSFLLYFYLSRKDGKV